MTPTCPVCDVDQPPAQAEPMDVPSSPVDGGVLRSAPNEERGSVVGATRAVDSGDGGPAEARGASPQTRRLCAAIAQGDRGAFAVFYQAWFDRCYAMARSLTRRDESFCLDVVQNTMLRVVRSIRAMESEGGLLRWMVRAVHSSAVDMLRSEARARRRDRVAARFEAPNGAATGSDAHTTEWLTAALAKLDDQQRDMLRLRFAGGGTLDAVGQAVGSTGDAAHGRLRRVLARLRRSANPP